MSIPGFELADGVYVGEGAEINPGAHLTGPCVIVCVPHLLGLTMKSLPWALPKSFMSIWRSLTAMPS